MGEFRQETERLILRDWREEDWPEFFEHTNTPAVMKHIGPVMDETAMADARQRYTSWAKRDGHTFWAVERKRDRAILGFCGIKRCDMAGAPIGEFELGWRLREDAWGQGYAREAAIHTRDLAFEQFAAPRVIALTVRRNAASWGLMRRIGMQRTPALDFHDPTYLHDEGMIIVHTLTSEDWSELRA